MATDANTRETDSIPPPQGNPVAQVRTSTISYWYLIGGLVVLLVSVFTLLPGTPDGRRSAVISGVLEEGPDDEAMTLTVEFNEPCSSDRTVSKVVEDANQISVTIEVDTSCGFGIALATTTLELAGPVGVRSIVNAETGETIRRLDKPTDLSIAGPLPGQ